MKHTKTFILLSSIFLWLLSACSGFDSSPTAEPSQQKETAVAPTENAVETNDDLDAGAAAQEPATATATPAQPKSETEDAVASEQSYAGKVVAPEFPAGLEWLNTGRPLSLADLRGKVVLLDFWTYGCINCMHVIPDLKKLEEKYADELVVIGVHSAKFENEGESENIRQVILRYELQHPVVNDKDFKVWNLYGARAWPTFVLIDPEGKVLGFHSGEGIYELFDEIIGGMVAEFDARDRIDRTPLALILEQESVVDSPLLFPGKVLADEAHNRLFIADSNHNRIVVTDLEGQVLDVIGSGRAALQDGDYETAAFFRPQGLALVDDTLYVADTENHAIRKVDLTARLVQTVAGTGEQGGYGYSHGPAASTALNSPWDVLYHDGIIYIAIAGQHQLWLYDPAEEVVRVFAGSGREELEDGPLAQAGLNQPSGLATDGRYLYFADSEASAVRAASLTSASEGIETIVGTGLFDFGDVDGTGDEVRLQHPLGVAHKDGVLYVADTYNNKIKRIDPETRRSSTFLGDGEEGWRDGTDARFYEPGGVSVTAEKLYIADTNNHVIRVADLQTKEVSTLVLVDMEGALTRQPPGEAFQGKTVTLQPQTVAPGAGTLRLDVALPEGYKLNDIAPFSVSWEGNSGIELNPDDAQLRVVSPPFPLETPATFSEGETSLVADVVIYYCEEEAESLCFIEQVRLLVPVSVTAGGGQTLAVSYTVPEPPDV